MSLTFFNVLLLFAAFCIIQFAFNFAWKIVDMKLSAKSIQQQLDAAYMWIIHKVINRKGKNNDSL